MNDGGDFDPTMYGSPEEQAAMQRYYERPLEPLTDAELDRIAWERVEWERKQEMIDDDLEWSEEDY